MRARKKTIGELFEDRKLMDAAARRAVREAVAENARLRKKMPRPRRTKKAA